MVIIRTADQRDAPSIAQYYSRLSDLTKRRFAPHSFTSEALTEILLQKNRYEALIALEPKNEIIVAYAITMNGTFAYDQQRWQQYGITLNNTGDATFAPSVADEWQGKGIGQAVLKSAYQLWSDQGYQHIFLWGSVQCSNVKAVCYYLKHGFQLKGYFEYQGGIYDMLKEL